ncbi:NUDIX hydrolase [Clostridium cylindrosporum]|uniref:8-oxo-dGTP diphosphatase MutX n=1 Tax=Clostridium cylindrosporum DSM 605 TaxID=1121307 RepID=A0A0J8D4L1_CLOCY|nr:8-oxo-dGTP diphosphatase [Clostridium cylindrosporum]KMT21105.1 8-oxo-dGTP diphosphatase MutX [Clostridium cylindrosporum DSM 605]
MKLATLCYIKKDGKTLMLHRIKKEKDYHKGKWNGVGGKFEPLESPEDCVKREVLEETGLNIINPRLRGMITFPMFDGEDDWYTFIFTAEEFSGNIKECSEGELHWIEDEKIMDLNLWDGDRVFLNWINGDKIFSAKFIYENKEFKDYKVIFY